MKFLSKILFIIIIFYQKSNNSTLKPVKIDTNINRVDHFKNVIKMYKKQYNTKIDLKINSNIKNRVNYRKISYIILNKHINIQDLIKMFEYFRKIEKKVKNDFKFLLNSITDFDKKKKNIIQNLHSLFDNKKKEEYNKIRNMINLINYYLKTNRSFFIELYDFRNYQKIKNFYKHYMIFEKNEPNNFKDLYDKSLFLLKIFKIYILNINKESTNLFVSIDKMLIKLNILYENIKENKINKLDFYYKLKNLKKQILKNIEKIKTNIVQLYQMENDIILINNKFEEILAKKQFKLEINKLHFKKKKFISLKIFQNLLIFLILKI